MEPDAGRANRCIPKWLAVSDGSFFGLLRQSAATTALSDDKGARTKSGVALRLPPQSIIRVALRDPNRQRVEVLRASPVFAGMDNPSPVRYNRCRI
jgi:hypothetical protein